MLINKETEQFYFGYRYKNVLLGRKSEDDLGIVYFTSSRHITKKNFSQFTFTIIAEFFDKKDAYWFEQQLIKDNKKNLLLINRHYQDPTTGVKEFVNFGHSNETKIKMTGKKRSNEFKEYRRAVMKGNIPWNKGLSKENDVRMLRMAENRKIAGNPHNIGKTYSRDQIEKTRLKLIGYKHTDETCSNMSVAKKGKTWEEIYGKEEANRKREIIKNRTGAKHPNSKQISTPNGIFPSLSEAVSYFWLSEGTIRSRCRNTKEKWKDWFYMEDVVV
jgi:hypothetical protein